MASLIGHGITITELKIRLEAYTLIGHCITITEPRLRLEAYTLSNRGRSLQTTDISNISWLEASTKAHYSLLTTRCSTLIAHCSLLIDCVVLASSQR